MEIISWKSFSVLILLYLLMKLYKFNRYIKNYLIPYEVKITSDEFGNNQHLIFVVRFGKGYLNRIYFTSIGKMENKNPLNLVDLKALLTLTEIKTFDGKNVDAEQEYYYVQSSNPNGTREYKINFTTVNESAIDNLMIASKSNGI